MGNGITYGHLRSCTLVWRCPKHADLWLSPHWAMAVTIVWTRLLPLIFQDRSCSLCSPIHSKLHIKDTIEVSITHSAPLKTLSPGAWFDQVHNLQGPVQIENVRLLAQNLRLSRWWEQRKILSEGPPCPIPRSLSCCPNLGHFAQNWKHVCFP